MIEMLSLGIKPTNHNSNCFLCKQRLFKGELQLRALSLGHVHPKCYFEIMIANIAQSGYNIDDLIAEYVSKSVLDRLKGKS